MRQKVWFEIEAVNGYQPECSQGGVREVVKAIQAYHFKQAFVSRITSVASGTEGLYLKIAKKGDDYTLHPCTTSSRDGEPYVKGKKEVLFSSPLLANVVKEAFKRIHGSVASEE